MAYEEALSVVNSLHEQVGSLVRAILTDLADGKLSPWEIMALGMRGMTLGSTIVTLVQGLSPEVRRDLLYVLEHGQETLPSPLESATAH